MAHVDGEDTKEPKADGIAEIAADGLSMSFRLMSLPNDNCPKSPSRNVLLTEAR
jgi:hypothetical protein